MRKILLIGWKDVTLAFRDRVALLMMLAAPFVLTVGMGFVTGRLSGGSNTGMGDIPVMLVNQDGGQLGKALVEVFQSSELTALVKPEIVSDPADARRRVDADQAAAAIVVPAGFTDSVIPAPDGQTSGAVRIIVYTNPSRPTSAGVVTTIVDEFVSRVEAGRIGALVSVSQLLKHGLIESQAAGQGGRELGSRLVWGAPVETAITVNSNEAGSAPVQFDVLAYMAPGMALMFLMFTTSNGGRTLLTERFQGTLPRMLVTPTTSAQVLGGKTLGIFLTGAAQMLILVIASALLFRLSWGSPLAVLLLVLAAVVGASGWGMLIAALARTPGQVSSVGSAITLAFGVLGGAFIDTGSMPGWLQLASKVTPNAWGVQGFATLAAGGGLADIAGPVAALLVMGVALFAVAVLILNRRGIAQQ